jgi:hypothetical protein
VRGQVATRSLQPRGLKPLSNPLADLGISHSQPSHRQKLAAIPEADASNHHTRTPANRFADSAV